MVSPALVTGLSLNRPSPIYAAYPLKNRINNDRRQEPFPSSHTYFIGIYPSYFKLHVRWLRLVTRITYLSKLIGTPSLAACLKLELFRVYFQII
ncbi:hypothetical protein BZY99_14770 [Pectobacterium versatile]|nr:hypothetical protein BZY99_14770 [Pectobacterium versatile]